MYFATPFWLFALIPWLVLSAWMLWGRRRRVRVPFLQMWEGPVLDAPPRRGMKLPPAGVVLAMIALLLAVAAAAGPILRQGGLPSPKPAICVIVDHGLTMSQPGADPRKPRYVAAAEELTRLLLADEPRSLPIAVIDPLSEQQRWTDLAGLADTVAGLAPTALDTRAQVAAAVGRVLTETGGPVVVLTDQPVDRPASPSVVRVSPPGAWSGITITVLSARAAPMPQVMLRIRNDSALSQITATVRSGRLITRTLVLPGRGKEQNYFFDLPLGETVEAQAGEARAYLLREGSAAKFFPSADLPAAVTRMVRVYVKEREKPPAAGDAKRTVQVVTNFGAAAGATPAVIVPPTDSAAITGAPMAAVDDPVTRGVNWSALAGPIRVSAGMPEGFRVVLSVAGHAAVAVREKPARQVWVGFDADGFSATPAFVVFWANVLDWVAGGEEQYSAAPLSAAMDGWRRVPGADDPPKLVADAPGIYARGDGSQQAFNAPVLPPPIAADSGQAAAIHRLAGVIRARPAGHDAGPIALWLALGCLLAAAAVWKRA